MKRNLALGLAVIWAGFALHAVVDRLAGWPRRLPQIAAPRAERERLEGGDDALHAFLVETDRRFPAAPRILFFSVGRGDSFEWYRAAFRLYPRRVRYLPVPALPPRPKFTLAVDPSLVAVVRDGGYTAVACFNRGQPAAHGWWTVAPGRKPTELAFTAVAPPATEPPASPEPSAGRWMLALLLLWPLGLALAAAAGLTAAFRDRPLTLAGLSGLLGVGGMAWLMQALALVGVRWSIPAILAAWAPVIAFGGWRAWRARIVTSASDSEPITASSSLTTFFSDRIRLAGLLLLALAAVLACVEVRIPVSAWGNWDAWAIWGLKAKACADAGGFPYSYLADVNYQFAHPDYPNGLPSVQAWAAFWAGGIDERSLRLLSAVHLACLAMLLPGVLGDLGVGSWRWPLAGAFLLLPKIQEFGTIGYADLPVAAWALATLAVLTRAADGRAAAWTVGLVGGLSTQTKDEGLMWSGGALVALAVWALLKKKTWKEVGWAAGILLLLMLPWKLTLHRLGIHPNDYVLNPSAMLDAMGDRLPLVARGYADEMWSGGATMGSVQGLESASWSTIYIHLHLSVLILWYVIPVALLLGFSRLIRSPHRELLLALLVPVSGYTAVYLASNRNIPFHVVTTADRVLLQLAPAWFCLSLGAAFSPALRREPEISPAGRTGRSSRPPSGRRST